MTATVVSQNPTWRDPDDLFAQVQVGVPPQIAALSPLAPVLALADRYAGEQMREEVLQIALDRGISIDEAKSWIYPQQRHFASFVQVAQRACGKPTYLSFGAGRTAEFDGALDRFVNVVSFINALLGISNVNGGGPGMMAKSARAISHASKVVAECGFKWPFSAETFQVLLHIRQKSPNDRHEAPHEFCTPQNTSWAIPTLPERTRMLLSLGESLMALVYPGGIGTAQELLDALVDIQLLGRIRSVFKRPLPIVLVDFKMSADRKGRRRWWCGPDREKARNWLRYDTIKPEDLAPVCFVNARSRSAEERIVRILDRSSKEAFGYSFVERWESENGRSLVNTARELAGV